jgi:hypothetical protein
MGEFIRLTLETHIFLCYLDMQALAHFSFNFAFLSLPSLAKFLLIFYINFVSYCLYFIRFYKYCQRIHIVENALTSPSGREGVEYDVIWGEKYEKGEEKKKGGGTKMEET